MTTAVVTALQTAMQQYRAGKPADAERICLGVLAGDPGDHTAAFLAGVIAMESGRLQVAAERFARAITVAPDNAAYHANLGEAERRLRRYLPATTALLKAIALRPDLAAPYHNLALVYQETDNPEGAIACLERAAELQPDLPGVQQRLAAARGARRRGGSSAASLIDLATTLAGQGRRADGITIARRALEMEPDLVAGHCNLGNMFLDDDQLDEAIASYGRALELRPDMGAVLANLGSALSRCGRVHEAIPRFEQAVALRSGDALTRSSYLYQLHFSPQYDARKILDEARRWDAAHGLPLARGAAAHKNDRSPGRRLRIGYLSPDFRSHCQAFFMFPLLANHDHENFEIFCYSDVRNADEFTTSLLRNADQWTSVVSMDDAAAAARIREDRVDILVDLTMHMANSRLQVFARKPAPVQITWLAYPGTTGLSAIDYRITDPFLDPPGSDTTVYAERSLHLPDTFWCYSPLTSEEVKSPLPARANGHVRFGCLNNFCKVNEAVIALWSRVLVAVPGSTLVLLVPPGESRRRAQAAFEKHGVSADRVEFVDKQKRLPYLATYRNIDVCLDTFPYNGHTTSLDAFWMGVPVVTLVGPTVVGRAGLCQAMNLGLPELVARTEDEFVTIAAGLAADLDRLAALRASLRERMEKSPLMDGPRFARALEAAYRRAWESWCAEAG